jgi:hypothetical protein
VPTEPKKLPSLRSDDPWERDVRERIRLLWAELSELSTSLTQAQADIETITLNSGVSSVNAGSAMVSVVPTTGAVVVDVVPSAFDFVEPTRTINTTAPLTGGGDLSADRTHAISAGANGQVLATSAGSVQWVTPSTISLVDGSGTPDKVTKWTPDGNTIGDSTITDSGALVTVANPLTVTGGITSVLGPNTVGDLRHTVESPAALTGTTNNWAIGANTTTVRASSTTGVIITGISGGAAGRQIRIINIGSNDLVFDHENGASTAANRIVLPGNSAWTLQGWTTGVSSIDLEYDGVDSRWEMVGFSGKIFPGALFTNDVTMTGALTVQGNATVGNATTDSHAFSGTLAHTANTTVGLTTTNTRAGATANSNSLQANQAGTFDTTGAGVTSRGALVSSTGSRSAGANNLTNVGLETTATGGQVNRALVTSAGDVILNDTSGTTTIKGATTIQSTLSVSGNVTIGDAGSDAHSLTGTLNANATAGSNGQILAVQSGVPQWTSLSSVSGVTGTGSANTLAYWTTATNIGSASVNVTGDVFQVNYSGGATVAHAAGSGSGVGIQASSASGSGASTIDRAGGIVAASGNFDTTAAARTAYGAQLVATGSRTAGANDLINIGGYLSASGGQVNRALVTGNGDVILNDLLGTTTIKGATTLTSTLSVEGNATIGNAAGDAHTINGTLDCNQAVNIDGNLVANANVTLGDGSADTHTLNGNITLQNAPTAGHIKVGSVQAHIWLAQQIFTSSGTYTPTTGTKAVLVRMIGGGGGGGGAIGGANFSCGGGGASGTYWERWFDPGASITGGAVTIGAAGAAGTSTGGNGGTGGDTSVVIQTVTYTAKGGGGGNGLATSTTLTFAVRGGQPTAGSSTGDVVQAEAGENGQGYGNGLTGGNGASSPLGTGGLGAWVGLGGASGAGAAGSGYGAGGGGGGANTATNRAGGAGTAGVVIIYEYA